MAKKRKKAKPVIASGLYNMVINPASLEKTAEEAQYLLTDNQLDAKEGAKGFLESFDNSNDSGISEQTEQPKENSALNDLFNFFK